MPEGGVEMERGNNIILIGMTGTGKSGVGRLLARQLNYGFADTDRMIEEVCGYTLSEVLRRYGNKRLLSEETLALKRLSGQNNLVIATGDRLPLNPENQPILRSLGQVILFYGSPRLVHSRIQKKKNKGLLGKNLSLEQVEEIIVQRQPAYLAVADMVIFIDGLSMEEIASRIMDQWDC